MKALVTGATGFVGAYLLHYLAADASGYTEIRALRRKNSPTELVKNLLTHPRITWVEGDILDTFSLEAAMEGVSDVFHCAATISFDSRDSAQMFKVNIEGTANVVNTALYCGVRKLLHISSIAAIGRSKTNNNFTENNSWQADPLNSDYAISKFYGEQEVWRAAAEGLKVAVVNPSIIIGSGYWNGGSPALIRTIAKGLKFYPLGATGYVDVRDVAKTMVVLMQSNVDNQRFIINGVNWTYQNFFNTLATALGVPQPTIAVNPFLRELAWRVEWLRARLTGKKVLITKDTARTSAYSFTYSSEKFKTAFPAYRFFDMNDTIAATADAYHKSIHPNIQILDII